MATSFDRSVDIIVVGTGAAASVAAIEAEDRGNQVLMIEKAPIYGGTTRISAGGIWIPNNRFLQEQEVGDPKEDCIKFMARASYPVSFHPSPSRYGLSQTEYALLETFYDNGSRMLDAMMDGAGLTLSGGDIQNGRSSYYHYPEDKVPRGRGIRTVNSDGTLARGSDLIDQLQSEVKRRGIPVILNTKAQRILQNPAGEVIGVEAASSHSSTPLCLGARKGVIFGTGGFAHNSELKQKLSDRPTFGSCAVKESEGDFLLMARAVGADLEGPAHGWWAEVVLEEALAGPITNDVWVPPGDSMIVVNRYGLRVVSEKLAYHVRTPVHFQWDPVRGEFPNLVLFMIYDQRTAEKFSRSAGVSYPLLAPDAPYVITGYTLEELTVTLQAKLVKIGDLPSGPTLSLAEQFTGSLRQSIQTFNGYARNGVDPDFHRGEIPIETDLYLDQGGANAGNRFPNQTMHPVSDQGPYHCIILAAGLLDTHGGPKIDSHAQVLDSSGKLIPGLYGAGNCVQGPAGKAYWGPGATLGLAMTFGYVAAVSASEAPRKEALTL